MVFLYRSQNILSLLHAIYFNHCLGGYLCGCKIWWFLKKKKHLKQFILICIHNFCDFKSFHCTKIHTIFGDLKLWRLSSKRSPHQSNMLYNNTYIKCMHAMNVVIHSYSEAPCREEQLWFVITLMCYI